MRRLLAILALLLVAGSTAAAQCPRTDLVRTGGVRDTVWIGDSIAIIRGSDEKAGADVASLTPLFPGKLVRWTTTVEMRGVLLCGFRPAKVDTVRLPGRVDTVYVAAPPTVPPPPPPPPAPAPPPTPAPSPTPVPSGASRLLPATQLAAWQTLKAKNDVRWQAALTWCGKLRAGTPGYGDTGLWCAIVASVDQDAGAAAAAIGKLRQAIALTDRNGIREAFLERVLVRDMLAPWLTAADYGVIDPLLQSYADNATGLLASDSDQLTGQGCGAILWDLATGATVDRSAIRQSLGRYVALAQGGAWPESSEYSPGTAVLFAMCELGYRSATGQEIVPGAEQFLRDAGRWAAFEVTPDFRSVVTWADDQTPRNLLAYRRPIELAAMPSPAGQWTWRELVSRYWPGQIDENLQARSMLLAQPQVVPAALGDGQHVATGLGLAIRRSGGDLGFLAMMNRTGVHHTMTVPFGDVQVYRNGEWALTHPAGYNGPWEAMVNGPAYAGLSLFPASGFVRADSGTTWLALTGRASGDYYAPPYYQPPPPFLAAATRQVVDATVGGCHAVIVRDSVSMVDPRTLAQFTRYRAVDQAKVVDADGKFWSLWHPPVRPTVTGTTATWSTQGGQLVTLQAWSDQPVQSAVFDETQLWSGYTYQVQGKAWQLRIRSDGELFQLLTICNGPAPAASHAGRTVTVGGQSWTFGAGVTGT